MTNFWLILFIFVVNVGTIKRVCETELGIISQCCQPKNASKNSKQYLENVALKINVKVGIKLDNLAISCSIINFITHMFNFNMLQCLCLNFQGRGYEHCLG